ncbi:glycosyltransferase [Conexibacter arvalis]|uniref:Glycosyltransferase involved in cell wall biosynthesis n=1 Tax=Conexibacter arvalis TaxID=912552 RepID=A0A840IBF4_9ACTN|nr:glycosyltransferase [Conexibacter arvalis]MBB4661675.1 glycosyltransferase involved in cell wall biosynthesis [Conexibacter arvalis]
MSARQGPANVDVSVLVPVLDESRDIADAVASMTAQEFDGTIEFLFADGRSTDDTRAKLEALAAHDPRIRVFDNPRRGTASGLNVCLREARGTYVVRMDAHTLYPACYVQAGVDRLRDGGAAWVAGPQQPLARGVVARAVVAALSSRLGRGASRRWSRNDAPEAEYELDTGVFCGVWRRADVLAHGGWDEAWPRNQDSELAARFLAAGERIVCLPAMAAQYIPRNSLRALWRQYRAYGSYRVKTAVRHPTSLRRSGLLPPLVVADALASVAAPTRRARRLARLGMLAYGGALAAAAADAARSGHGSDALLVPVALATMHLAHGTGFYGGCRRWGTPWPALANVARRRGATAIAPYAGPVEAPSLHAGDR